MANAPVAPDKSRDELIADERAAEALVAQKEIAYRLLEAQSAPAETQAAAYDELVVARRASLATRDAMRAGFDAWTAFFAYREVLADAEARGIPLPEA